MKRLACVAVIMLVAAGAVRAAWRQEGMEPPKPGKEHQFLAQCVGTWDVVMKMQMDPSQPAIESKMVATETVGCNGLWVISDVKGEVMGGPFHGHGLWGYDTGKKKFVGAWIDSLGTYLTTSEGTWDEKANSLTSISESPMGKMKEVHTIKDKDNRTSQFFMIGKDGKESPMMTLTMTRKK